MSLTHNMFLNLHNSFNHFSTSLNFSSNRFHFSKAHRTDVPVACASLDFPFLLCYGSIQYMDNPFPHFPKPIFQWNNLHLHKVSLYLTFMTWRNVKVTVLKIAFENDNLAHFFKFISTIFILVYDARCVHDSWFLIR